MQEENYRAWLIERGDQKDTVDSSVNTINSLASRLEALDLPTDALTRANSLRDFEKVDQALQDLHEDLKNGGERYRLVSPNTDQPRKSLDNLRSHLRKYRQFALGEDQSNDWKSLERLKETFLSELPTSRTSNRPLGNIVLLCSLLQSSGMPRVLRTIPGAFQMKRADTQKARSFRYKRKQRPRFGQYSGSHSK